jgi:8-oxo-dGTP diphosphatase
MDQAISVAGILQKEGKFCLGLRQPGGDIGNLWEFFGGKVDPGETPHIALKREFLEELDLPITVGQLIASGRFSHHGRDFWLWGILVHPLKANIQPGPDHQKVQWFSLEEMAQLDLVPSDQALLMDIQRYFS